MVARRISRTQLLGYLDKLSREEPLPEPKLYQAADQFGLSIDQLLANATRSHIRRDLVRYSGVDQDTLLQWQRMAEERHAVARIDQSIMGNSHGARVSGAMVNVRSSRQPHPQVVMVNDQGEISAPPESSPAARLIIVENLENFLSLDGTLSPSVSLVVQLAISPEFNQSGAAWEHSCHVILKNAKPPY